jgi:hypothetical protein
MQVVLDRQGRHRFATRHMDELIRESMPYTVPALLPALFLLLAPLCSPRTRTVLAAILLLVGAGFVIDVLVLDHTHLDTLAVPNVFRRAGEAEPHVWTTETVTAPAWHWHFCVTAILWLPGFWLLLRRKRAPHAPSPVLFCTGVFLWYLLARLGLEKTAAPRGLVWALGGTPSLLVILPFFAWYCSRRGWTFGRFAGGLVLLGFLQRLPLIAIAWYATTRQRGTHLDTHVVTDVDLPLLGERQLHSATESWIYPTLIPHLTGWILVTVVAGLVLGALPFVLARRRTAAVAPA